MDDQRKWISVDEAAVIVGITPRTLRQHLRRGTVPGEKIGRTWRISRKWAENLRDDKPA